MQGDGWANMPGDGINEGAYGCSWSLRRGDDQKQVRIDLEDLINGLKSGSLSSMF